MREIKFRAWDKDIKKMYPVDTLDSEGKTTFTHHALPEDTLKGNNCRHLINYELMQFTGLLDSKGKEIWEGNIVRWETSYGDIWEVHYHNGGWVLADLPDNSEIEPRIRFDLYGINCEVIGNIYENSELLKEKP